MGGRKLSTSREALITCTDSSTSDDTKVHNEFDRVVDGSRTCLPLADGSNVFSPLTPHHPVYTIPST